jgi:hypothetical protein
MTSCKEGKSGKTVFEPRSPYDPSSENFYSFSPFAFQPIVKMSGEREPAAAAFASVNPLG